MKRAGLVFVPAMVWLVACAGAQGGNPERSVSYGEYCERTGKAACKCLSNGVGALEDGCNDTFGPSCVGSRDTAALTGRNEAQTAACETALQTQCQGIMVGHMPPACPPLGS